MNRKNAFKFRNWAGNNRVVAKFYFQPETEQELLEIIHNSKKIRVVGSGHSWSALCINEDTLINLDRFNKVIHFDKKNLTLKVQAGIKLREINQYLDQQGYALSNLGSVSEQSLAGAISTGTHGSGKNFQVLASQAVEFSLVKANGEKIVINKNLNPGLFNLAIINLGSLGIISEITLNIVPGFRLHDKSEVMKFDAIIEKINDLVEDADHFKIWWFPHIEEAVIFRYTRTQDNPNDSKIRQWFMDDFISVIVYRFLLKLGNFRRKWRKKINNILVNKLISPLNRVEKSHKVFNVPKPPIHRETEWGFDLKNAREILSGFKNLINNSGHHINFLQEIRFTKGDNFALSPCFQRDTMWVGCYNADDFEWENLLTDFETFAIKHRGRPHWGKEFKVGGDYLFNNYPDLERFNLLRKQFDPLGKFENPLISKIFSSF